MARKQKKIKKVVVVWPNIARYVASCLYELNSLGVRVLAVQEKSLNQSNKTFRLESSDKLAAYSFEENTLEEIIRKIDEFDPDLLLVSVDFKGPRYKIAKRYHDKGKPVIGALDSFFKLSYYQLKSIYKFRRYAQKVYSIIWVPGYRSFNLAKKMGFPESRIVEGLYTSDSGLFQTIGESRSYSASGWPSKFLFIGQYIERKGLDILLEAYGRYRKQVENPWELWCIGDGPLKPKFQGIEGVRDLGSQPPEKCAMTMKEVGAFVITSREDHWPLVIHEASSAGLPVIASSNCGNTVELLRNGISGVKFENENLESLVAALHYVSSQSPHIMGRESYHIACKYNTQKWATLLLDFIPYMININQI